MSLKNAHKQDVYDISDISDIEKTSWRRGEVFNCYLSLSPTLKLHDENKDGTASTGYFDGFHWGEGKHPWVKAMVSKGHADISYGGIGMLPMSDGRYRNTP